MLELREVGPLPDVPEPQRGEGKLTLRYEDVTQDGRMLPAPMTYAVSASVWRRTIPHHPIWRRFEADEIVPILARLKIEAGGGPIGVRGEVDCRGMFELVRTEDAQRRVRVRLDAWAEVTGRRGRTFGPPPEGAGEPILLGRVIAQHVLTRPFVKDRERRQVHALPGGLPDGTSMREEPWSEPTSVLALPEGARWIDEAFIADPCPVVLGLGHTDSNQHVNSLVYPRLFEDAALRRFDAHGESTSLFARYVELAFRKPCFAGDRVRVLVRAYRAGDELGVVGAVVTDETSIAPDASARCFVRMQLTR